MKTKILLLATVTMFLGWSCNKNDNGKNPTPPAEVEVSTPDAAQDALNNGSTTITLTNPLSGDAGFVIPNSYPTGTEVNLVIPANGYDVEIKQDNTKAQAFPVVHLKVESAENITLLTPNCSVVFDGTTNSLVASTADNTLTVTKGSVVSTLTIQKGSVKIYGLVSAINQTANSGKIYLALGSGSDRPSTDNIIKQTLELPWVDGIILTEDKYPLSANITATGNEFDQDNAAYAWYLPIEKDGFEIIGDGNVEDIILYGKEEQANGVWSSQNLITVFASDVTIDGITMMNKVEGNKMIEVLNSGFTVRNSRFVLNTQVAGGTEDFVGGIYFSQKADKGLVENNYFNAGTVSVDGLMSGTFNVTGNTFDGVYGGDYVVISTPNWTTNDVSTSTMSLTLTKNAFKNVPEFKGDVTYPVLNLKYGTVTANENTFPTDGIYYRVIEHGKLVLNGVTIVPTDK